MNYAHRQSIFMFLIWLMAKRAWSIMMGLWAVALDV